jgi:hypothetical protein
MNIGDKVVYYNPVSKRNETFYIVGLKDHKPVDGVSERCVIAELDNGTSEFVWNLKVIK